MSDIENQNLEESAEETSSALPFELIISPDYLEVSLRFLEDLDDPANQLEPMIPLIHGELERLEVEADSILPITQPILLEGIKNSRDIIVAKKEHPQKGVKGKIEFIVELEFSPQTLDKLQSKDPKNLGTTERLVNEHQELVHIVKEIQGSPYLDILGQERESEPIAPISAPKFDDNSIVQTEVEDGWILKSKKKGYFQRSNESLEISSEIVGNKVDFSSIGNVLGDGSIDIRIQGDRYADKDTVCEGFHLIGNRIEIVGNLGNSVILEGNDIVVKGKIRQNCHIVAKSSLSADYVQGATIEAPSVSINDCWFSKIRGKNVLIRKDLVGSKLFGEKALLLGEAKNSSVMMTHSIAIERTHELEPSRLTISPFAIEKNQKKHEKLKLNVQNGKMAIFKTQTLLDQQKKIGNSLIKNIIENVSKLNMLLYNSEQKEKVAYLLKMGHEAPWLNSLKTTPTILEKVQRLGPVRKEIQELTKTLGLNQSHLKMSESALERILNLEENAAIFALNDILQGSRVVFGETDMVITKSRIGSYRYYIKNGVIGSKEFKVKSSDLKNCREDVVLFLKTLRQVIGSEEESPKD